MWLIERQQMHNVSIRIDLLMLPAGSHDVPCECPLHRIAARRETQILHATLHRFAVAIKSLVSNVKLHDQSFRRRANATEARKGTKDEPHRSPSNDVTSRLLR